MRRRLYKNKNKKNICIAIFFIFLCAFAIVNVQIRNYSIVKVNNTTSKLTTNNNETGTINESEDVYDVILFFGQSNMAGNMSNGIETRYNLEVQDSINAYSEATDIDKDIIENSYLTNYTITDVEPGTVYEYHVSDNSLYDLSELENNGYIIDETSIQVNKFNGELLYYDYNECEFYTRWDTDRPSEIQENSYTFSNAYGTNMINEFAKLYYEKTGHKVVCVHAAMGGQKLENFTPGFTYEDANGSTINMYSAMSSKYLAAINYLENNNMNIGNRFFIMFQGENEAGHNSTSIISSYKSNFQKIKEQLNEDLGINKGAIVLTGFYPGLYEGSSYGVGVKSVNQAQTEIINENADIIMASDYPFKHYVPSEEEYNNTSDFSYKVNNGNLDYETALANSKLIVGSENDDNLFHFTSAALAQIGRDTAINLYNSTITEVSTLTIELQETSYTYDGTEKKPKVTVKSGNVILTEGVDYTVEYTNNVNAGAATVNVIGKGSYTGSKTVIFEIMKEDDDVENNTTPDTTPDIEGDNTELDTDNDNGSPSDEDTTTSKDNLPQTGEGDFIIKISLLILSFISIYSFIRYKYMTKIKI